MKQAHKPSFYGWSRFDEARDIDFHSWVWVRPEGCVVIDPLPLSPHDRAHLDRLGPVTQIILSNSDHVRDAAALAAATGAEIWGPAGERESFPIPCAAWLADGDSPLPGLKVFALSGSKTPGELALLIEDETLITGDLVRSHCGGRLCLLPDPKLGDKPQALSSLARLAALREIEAVLPGDGWPVFRHGHEALAELAASLG